MNSPSVLLELQHLSKSYGEKSGSAVTHVLIDVCYEHRHGESTAIIGPSGSGKSTLLNLIGTLDRPSSGGIRFNGVDLVGMSEAKRRRYRNQEIGFVFQDHHLLPQCTTLENILLPTLAFPDSQSSKETIERARMLLETAGIDRLADRRPGEISGGERQRVAVLRALINSPRLVLADEPTGALDRRTAAKIVGLLVDLKEYEKMALIIVTHSLTVAHQMDRVMCLADGVLTEYENGAR